MNAGAFASEAAEKKEAAAAEAASAKEQYSLATVKNVELTTQLESAREELAQKVRHTDRHIDREREMDGWI